jgi:hypothetical protein
MCLSRQGDLTKLSARKTATITIYVIGFALPRVLDVVVTLSNLFVMILGAEQERADKLSLGCYKPIKKIPEHFTIDTEI